MEKILEVDGKKIPFKATGSFPLRYKSQFGRDVFADMAKLEDVSEDTSKLDTEVFYNIIWTMAKSADPNIPPLLDWLDGFNEFPVFTVFQELNDLLLSSVKTTKN